MVRKTLCIVSLLCIGACCVAAGEAQKPSTSQPSSSQAATLPHTKLYWRHLLSRVHVGMRRARVEKILGHVEAADIDASPELNAKAGKHGAHTSLYVLDKKWCAAVTYDFSGFTEKNNPYMVMHMPEHRVIAPPRLRFRSAMLNRKLRGT